MRECPLENGNSAEVFVAYGAQTLAPETLAVFERHLAECSACREVADAQQAVWLALDSWSPEPVSADFDRKLFQRIAAEEQGTWWRRMWSGNWSWRPAMPVAAACAVLIAAFVLRGPVTPSIGTPSQNQPQLQIEQVQHALDDIEMLKQLGVETAADKPGSPGQL